MLRYRRDERRRLARGADGAARQRPLARQRSRSSARAATATRSRPGSTASCPGATTSRAASTPTTCASRRWSARELIAAAAKRARGRRRASARRMGARSCRGAGSDADRSAAELALDDELARARAAPSRPPLRDHLSASSCRSSSIASARASRAWYELFPRSAAAEPGATARSRDCEARLPYVAELGFDVLYLPPIHPIGREKRKGTNNALDAGARRRRQPVGDRRGRGRPQGDPSRARHARGLPRASSRGRASTASRSRSTSRSSARPTTRT